MSVLRTLMAVTKFAQILLDHFGVVAIVDTLWLVIEELALVSHKCHNIQ